MYLSLSPSRTYFFFFFNDTATTEIYTLSLHDALPISHSQHSRLQPGGENGLHQRLSGLEVLAADGSLVAPRQLVHCGDVDRQVGRAVGKGHALAERGIGIYHRRSNIFVILFETLFKRLH